MKESMSWESDGTHHIVLFIEKNPTPCTHARSLFIGQEPVNAVVHPVKSVRVAVGKYFTSLVSSVWCYF